MNRREAIIAGITGITAAVAVAPTADAQASEGANPDLDQIRALLRAHDEAFTNHDLKGIMACLTEKAAIMGSGPGEVWSGPDEIKVAYEHFFEGFDKGRTEIRIPVQDWRIDVRNGLVDDGRKREWKKGWERVRVSPQSLPDRGEKGR
jgi:hypothetical protein